MRRGDGDGVAVRPSGDAKFQPDRLDSAAVQQIFTGVLGVSLFVAVTVPSMLELGERWRGCTDQ